MSRFTANTVFFGFVRAWRLAIWPTSRSPLAVKPTMDGVVRAPSWLGITWERPPSITATQELVVPRSILIDLTQSSPRSKSRQCTALRPAFARAILALGHLDQGGTEEAVALKA